MGPGPFRTSNQSDKVTGPLIAARDICRNVRFQFSLPFTGWLLYDEFWPVIPFYESRTRWGSTIREGLVVPKTVIRLTE